MRNILIILSALLLFTALACTKTKQSLFHHKDWKNMQGTWDIQQVLIDGVDSTSAIKDNCYRKYFIGYQSEDRDGTLHLFDQNGDDFGSIYVEASKYKTMAIKEFNLNIEDYYIKFFSHCRSPLAHKNLLWKINVLTEQELHISILVDNRFYQVKYQKL
jgi:hypothetical protein